jgi:hypothetical protein
MLDIEGRQRAAVVAEARSWLGTPYHNCADLKGVGVDCGMLLVRVFVDTGLVPPFDPRPYPADWHLHRSDEKYLGFIFDHGSEVEAPQPGDVVVFKIGRCYSHGGIVTVPAPLTIVHAYFQARRVIEEDITRDSRLMAPARKPRFFSFWVQWPVGSGKSEIGIQGSTMGKLATTY